MLQETSHYIGFRLAVEVDEYVAAEDQIEGFTDAVVAIVEIDAAKLDHRLELRLRAHATFFSACPAEHPGFLVRGRNIAATLDRPHAFAGGLEDTRREIGSENLDRPSFFCRKVRRQNH